MQQPSTMQGKNLDSPDETREFENGKMNVVNLGEVTVGRAVFEPGWRWSENVALRKNLLGTIPVGAVFAARIYRPSASAPAPAITALYTRYWKPPRAGPRRFARLARFPKKTEGAGTQGLAVSEGEVGRPGLRCLR